MKSTALPHLQYRAWFFSHNLKKKAGLEQKHSEKANYNDHGYRIACIQGTVSIQSLL